MEGKEVTLTLPLLLLGHHDHPLHLSMSRLNGNCVCVCDVEETLMPVLTKFLCAISVVVPVADVAEQDTRKFHCQ